MKIPPLIYNISTCTNMRPSGLSHLKARFIITLWKSVFTCVWIRFLYLQLTCINTDNVKDERGNENVNWGRRTPEFGEDLLRWEIARQHSCSESLFSLYSATIVMNFQLLGTCYGRPDSWSNAWCVWAKFKHPLKDSTQNLYKTANHVNAFQSMIIVGSFLECEREAPELNLRSPESQSSVSNQMHLPHSSTTWHETSIFDPIDWQDDHKRRRIKWNLRKHCFQSRSTRNLLLNLLPIPLQQLRQVDLVTPPYGISFTALVQYPVVWGALPLNTQAIRLETQRNPFSQSKLSAVILDNRFIHLQKKGTQIIWIKKTC